MSVVNAMNGEPVVHLHGRILRGAKAGTTVRYEAVRSVNVGSNRRGGGARSRRRGTSPMR